MNNINNENLFKSIQILRWSIDSLQKTNFYEDVVLKNGFNISTNDNDIKVEIFGSASNLPFNVYISDNEIVKCEFPTIDSEYVLEDYELEIEDNIDDANDFLSHFPVFTVS